MRMEQIKRCWHQASRVRELVEDYTAGHIDAKALGELSVSHRDNLAAALPSNLLEQLSRVNYATNVLQATYPGVLVVVPGVVQALQTIQTELEELAMREAVRALRVAEG
jgi:hypothetical protein